METEGAPSVNPIRLNDASASELQHVHGLGVVLAQRIVAYRDEHGPFASLADLASVPGIGRAALQRLAPQLTIEVPAALAEGSDAATAGGREYGAIAVPGAVAPDPALMKGSYAMGTDRPNDYQDAREEPTPEERAEERIPEVPPVEGLEPEEREPIPVEPSVTEGGVEETPEERPGATEEPVVPPDRGEPAGAPSPWAQTTEPPAPPPEEQAPPPTEERPPEEVPPERVAGAGPPPPPQRPRDTGERRDGGRSFWSWLLAALLGGLAGVLLTLLLLLLLTGTLDFASSREVNALSSNLDALASNQQQIAGRVDDLAQRADELERRAEEMEAALGRIDDLEAQVTQAADDLGALQSDVSELRNQVSISLRSLDRRVNALDQSLSSLEETVESLQATVDDVRERVGSFDAFFVALRDLLIDLEGPPEDTQGAGTPTGTPTADATVTPETTPSPEPTATPDEEASPTPTPAG